MTVPNESAPGERVEGASPEPTPGSPRRRRPSTARLGAVGVGAVIVALVVVLAFSKTHTDSAASPLLGKVAPSLTGTTLDGKPFDLSNARGKFVVVNFFASWCQPCQDEAPELRRWAAKHQATGDAELVNVLFDDTPSAARRFFAQQGGANWPVLAVDTNTMGLDWGVAKVPETFVVNPQGIVVVKTIAEVTEADLDRFMARFSSGATTVPPTTSDSGSDGPPTSAKRSSTAPGAP